MSGGTFSKWSLRRKKQYIITRNIMFSECAKIPWSRTQESQNFVGQAFKLLIGTDCAGSYNNPTTKILKLEIFPKCR